MYENNDKRIQQLMGGDPQRSSPINKHTLLRRGLISFLWVAFLMHNAIEMEQDELYAEKAAYNPKNANSGKTVHLVRSIGSLISHETVQRYGTAS